MIARRTQARVKRLGLASQPMVRQCLDSGLPGGGELVPVEFTPEERVPIYCATARDCAAALSALTPAESASMYRLAGIARAADWRAGRLAAKRAVSAALGGKSLRRIEIGSRGDERPRALLTTAGLRRPVHVALSLAHSGGRAVAAVTRGVRVGVDIERVRRIPAEHARFFLTASERRSGLSELVCWTVKEAAWKALGLTRADPFMALELIWNGAELAAVRCAEVKRKARAVVTHSWSGFVIAVVVVAEAA